MDGEKEHCGFYPGSHSAPYALQLVHFQTRPQERPDSPETPEGVDHSDWTKHPKEWSENWRL